MKNNITTSMNNPSITTTSKHIQGVVAGIYHAIGEPWYIRLTGHLAVKYGLTWLWNFRCRLSDNHKSKIMDDAAYIAFTILDTHDYFSDVGTPECDKEFLTTYRKQFDYAYTDNPQSN